MKLRTRIFLATIPLLLFGTAAPAVPVERPVASAEEAAHPKFPEVGQIPVPDVPGFATAESGWLILSPASRRGYVLVESGNQSIIQSFDLDTLRVRQQTIIPGTPIPSGTGQGTGGGAVFSGDVVHTVDANHKRLYIAINNGLPTGTDNPPDRQRMLSHILVLDEQQFDADPEHAFGAFTVPGEQQRLQTYPLLGLAMSHHHVKKGEPGKLLAVFAGHYPISHAPVSNSPLPGAYDHTVAQWDARLIKTGAAAPPFVGSRESVLQGAPAPLPVKGDWEKILVPCGTASMTSPGGSDADPAEAKNYQWGILAIADAVLVGCQSAMNSGAVVRVPVDPKSGMVTADAMQLVALGKPIGDVLVAPGGGRLYVRSFGGGSTWWTFDAATMRFTGAIAGTLREGPMAAGVNPETGRLYTLTPDTCVVTTAGALPVHGGINVTEAALEPVPAPENVRPDMAYNSWWAIGVDTVTDRVFIRRGIKQEGFQDRYPNCDQNLREVAPVEGFYRVFQDRTPKSDRPSGLDDSQFTTNVPEDKDLTQASFLGTGTGYGARVVLTGGLDALTQGAASSAESLCGRVDRELLGGSVGRVELSDQSTTADAASLDADAATQEAFGNPISRCRPQAPEPQGSQINRCHGDTEELSFDDRQKDKDGKDVDENKDGCPDRTGVNRYGAVCVQNTAAESTDKWSDRAVPRDGFEAKATCNAENETADANAEASLGNREIEEFQATYADQGVPIDPVRIGRAQSTVEVTRKLGKGVVVSVDSIARGIELPGVGTIGVVRAEATSTATGRDARAWGEFTRTICDVRVGTVVFRGCTGDRKQQESMVKQLNDAFGGRGEVRLRQPDDDLARGTQHGYLAGVERDRKQLFSDQSISRDRSLAIPGLEIVLYHGDGGSWGAGRQIVQLAGVQASTSYGITCVYGQGANGKCLTADEGTIRFGPDLPLPGGPDTPDIPGVIDPDPRPNPEGGQESLIERIVKAPFRAIAHALRLLFNNPRELGLLATVWALLYAPCYLGERRRSITGLRDARATAGGV